MSFSIVGWSLINSPSFQVETFRRTLLWKAVFERLEILSYTPSKVVLWKLYVIIRKKNLYNTSLIPMEQSQLGKKRRGVLREKTGNQTSASVLPQTSCVALGKLLNHSAPQFPHLENGTNAYSADCFESPMS